MEGVDALVEDVFCRLIYAADRLIRTAACSRASPPQTCDSSPYSFIIWSALRHRAALHGCYLSLKRSQRPHRSISVARLCRWSLQTQAFHHTINQNRILYWAAFSLSSLIFRDSISRAGHQQASDTYLFLNTLNEKMFVRSTIEIASDRGQIIAPSGKITRHSNVRANSDGTLAYWRRWLIESRSPEDVSSIRLAQAPLWTLGCLSSYWS